MNMALESQISFGPCCTKFGDSCQSKRENFMECFEKLSQDGLIPRLDETADCRVYTITYQSSAPHVGVVFGYSYDVYVAFSLAVNSASVDSQRYFISARVLDRDEIMSLRFCGNLSVSAREIIKTAIDTKKHATNCYYFGRMVLENLGIQNAAFVDIEYESSGGGQRAFLVSTSRIFVTVAIAGALLYFCLKGN